MQRYFQSIFNFLDFPVNRRYKLNNSFWVLVRKMFEFWFLIYLLFKWIPSSIERNYGKNRILISLCTTSSGNLVNFRYENRFSFLTPTYLFRNFYHGISHIDLFTPPNLSNSSIQHSFTSHLQGISKLLWRQVACVIASGLLLSFSFSQICGWKTKWIANCVLFSRRIHFRSDIYFVLSELENWNLIVLNNEIFTTC